MKHWKNLCPKRWNTTYDMMNRIIKVEPALISTIHKFEKVTPLNKSDFVLMKRVVKVLKFFKEATEMLSKSDASISQCIPIITTIMDSLKDENTRDDHGVKTFKKDLLAAMYKRFGQYERNENYFMATFLDPRYRRWMFRSLSTMQNAKALLIKKLQEKLESNDSKPKSTSVSSNVKSNDVESLSSAMNLIIKKQQKESALNLAKEEILMLNEIKDTVQEYYEGKSELSDPCFDFWKEKSVSSNRVWRAMSELAQHYLTPSATSVAVERLFSTAGDILSDERNRLLPANAEKLLFLRENIPKIKFQTKK